MGSWAQTTGQTGGTQWRTVYYTYREGTGNQSGECQVDVGTETAVSTSFQAGNISNCLPEWEAITDNDWLDMISGVHIPLIDDPVQLLVPFPFRFHADEKVALGVQVEAFCSKGIVVPTTHSQGEFI